VDRERRRFTRISLNVPTILSVYRVEGYHTGRIANISSGGCFLPIDAELPVGEVCEVTIMTGEGLETEKVTVSGKIVRSDAEGAGVMFTDCSSANGLQLKRIVARYEEEQ